MRKHEELTDPTSCLSRALDNEMVFTLLGRDEAAPDAIRAWIAARIRRGKNQPGDYQLVEAEGVARVMEADRMKIPDKISTDWLFAHNACAEEIEGFEDTFPDAKEGVALTRENLIRAKIASLNTRWLAEKILDASRLSRYLARARTIEGFYTIEFGRAQDSWLSARNEALLALKAGMAKNVHAVDLANIAGNPAFAVERQIHKEALAAADLAYSQATNAARETRARQLAETLADVLGLP